MKRTMVALSALSVFSIGAIGAVPMTAYASTRSSGAGTLSISGFTPNKTKTVYSASQTVTVNSGGKPVKLWLNGKRQKQSGPHFYLKLTTGRNVITAAASNKKEHVYMTLVAPTLNLIGLKDGEALTSAPQTVTVKSNELVSLWLNGKRQSGKGGKYNLKLSVGQNTITAEVSNGAKTVKKSIHVGLSGEDTWATNYMNSWPTYSGIQAPAFKEAAKQLAMDPSSADSIKKRLLSIPAWKETIDGTNQEWQVNFVYTWTKNYKQFPSTKIGINNLFRTLPPIQNGSVAYEGNCVYYNAKTKLYTLSDLQVGIEPPGVDVAPIL
ncbi:hypothetical protein [Alicyclobacillus kakegawensis]|uniref:hypothetical protein n=1 Tax=Alicyclobacillus kakegawensis TaxID=392012 RepID=UPI000836D5FF|nr:hypothetical protein [Alicyclobacillus kakegawensis]